MKNGKKVWILLLVLALAVWIYAMDGYDADAAAQRALVSHGTVEVIQSADRIVFSPQEIRAGFVFYPGGKVEHTAYAPLMQALAEEGIFCVLLKMPLKLAVLDGNAAAEIPSEYPEVDRWYVGGHSLGGSIAANFLAQQKGFQGLVMLAAYSIADLTDADVAVLSIYGDQDQILNLEKYDQYWGNLPENTVEMVLPGGDHAQFGSYGPQAGDGEPVISRETQTELTAEAISAFIQGE